MKRSAHEKVDVPGEDVFDLLQIGQHVDTPIGPGVISDIALQAARYRDRIELEPPAITVRLDDPPPGAPDEVTVCMCKLGLENPKNEALIRKEFSRLWPPITDEVPGDSHMLINDKKDNGDIEHVRSRFEKQSTTAHRVASVALRQRRQRRVFLDYVELSLRLAEPIIDTVKQITAGMVVTGIEGVDKLDEAGVVLNSRNLDENGFPGKVYLLIYNPETDSVRQLTLPEETQFMGHDGGEATGFTPTVYDPAALNSPELHPIRILPNSYLPKNPNYPSSITDTVWRPTVRMTPIRFYQTKKKEGGFNRLPEGEGPRKWPPTRTVNFPTPDTVNPSDKTKNRKRGKDAFDPADQTPDMEADVDQKMEDLAMDFWGAYQHYREQKIPGKGNTLDIELNDFADVYQGRHEMDDEEMMQLFNYLVQIGILDASMLKKYLLRQDEKFRQLNTRTHY
jgi:hypothetical protein